MDGETCSTRAGAHHAPRCVSTGNGFSKQNFELPPPPLPAATSSHGASAAYAAGPIHGFTACLTTPLRMAAMMALRWHASRRGVGSAPRAVTVARSAAYAAGPIHGRLGDRKTSLGELAWVYTSVCDSIACGLLRLFRHDSQTAALFRSSLLAQQRVLGAGAAVQGDRRAFLDAPSCACSCSRPRAANGVTVSKWRSRRQGFCVLKP